MLQWSDNLSVGVRKIDEQHKKLVDLVNKLHDGMMQRRGREIIGGIVKELADYTVYHFKTEEELMNKYNYPESPSHKKQHAEFVDKVSDFTAKFEKKQISLTVEVHNFLSNWLINHIKKIDKSLGGFLKDKGEN